MTIPAFTLARRLRAGETVFSAWCSLPYPIVAEMLGREGFAAVTLEAQHGLWDTASLLTGVAAVRQAGVAPIVRVPVNDFALASRVLDFGAEALIAPMINTAADARAFAAAAKYPPVGERSCGASPAASATLENPITQAALTAPSTIAARMRRFSISLLSSFAVLNAVLTRRLRTSIP